MRLILVRHGRTEAYDKGLYAGSSDVHLSKKGIDELKELKKQYIYPESDYYLSSGMFRANETFEILYPGKSLDGFLPGFAEHDGGDLEGKPREDSLYTHRKWLEGETSHNEEPYRKFEKRVIKSLRQLYEKYHDNTVTVITHAGVMKVIYAYLKNVEPVRQYDMYIKNGGYYIYDIDSLDDELILNDFEAFDLLPLYSYDNFRLMILRHGLTDGNTAKILTGCDHEYMLTEEGIKQLREKAAATDYPETEMHFTSSMIRAQDTFKILFPNIKPDGKIYKCREVSFGRYDGTPVFSLDTRALFHEWLKDEGDMGFEQWHLFQRRCMSGIVDIINSCGNKGYSSATLMCHMGTMRAILIYLEKLDRFSYMQIQANNGGGHVLEMKIRGSYEIFSDRDI